MLCAAMIFQGFGFPRRRAARASQRTLHSSAARPRDRPAIVRGSSSTSPACAADCFVESSLVAGLAGCGSVVLPVAAQAVPHVQPPRTDRSRPSPALARGIPGRQNPWHDVAFVREVGVTRAACDASPLNGSAALYASVSLMMFGLFTATTLWQFMHTFKRGHGRCRRALRIAVAIEAGDVVCSRVQFVAEGNSAASAQ